MQCLTKGINLPCGSRTRQVASSRSPRPAVRRPCLVQQHRGQEPAHQSSMGTPRRVAASAVTGSSPAAPAPEAQQQSVYVPVAELQDLCHRALRTLGYTEPELRALTDVMMYAQLRDNNQGVIKITSGGMNRSPTAGAVSFDKETRWSAVLNGNGQAGMLVLSQAMRMAIDKAKVHGFGIVGTNHTSTSTGALGYYAEQVAREGLIGVVFAQSPEFVAPHGSKQALFGTNPIAIAIPAAQGPVVMDMATAAYAWFGLLEAKTAGRPIPGDVAQDAAGRPTTDPNDVLNGGAIRVFDRSHKGSGLSLMVELLAGPLVGAAITDKLGAKNWGNLLLALDPELLGDREEIKQRVQVVLDRVKGAERQPGVAEILLPGERGARLATQRLSSGMMPIESNLYNALRVMAAKDTTPPGGPAGFGAAGNGGSNGSSLSSNGAAAAAAGAVSSSTSGAAAAVGRQGRGMATRLLHPEEGSVQDPYHASGPPLYQTATYAQPSATDCGPYDYTRSGNPTRTMFEEQWAALEGADRALAFTSGMAALAVAVKLVSAGGHIVAGDDIYGGTSRLLSAVVPAAGVAVSNVDMTDLSAVKAALIPGKTQLVMIESPTNPRMQICDIAAISRAAHEAGALVIVDNSFMTPLMQRPLDLGADISMTSGTKYIGGHGDITLGMLAVKGEELAKRVYFLQNAEGAGLAPLDCWLAARGLKTMALRLERSQDNAAKLARFLAAHPLVTKLNYAGYERHPGAALHAQQANGSGAVLSFETGDVEVSKIIVNETKLFKVTVSFGNVVSLISLPCYMSHASIPAEVRAARGLPDDLVRISAGIEDSQDLIADLSRAMDLAAQHLAKKQAAAAAASGNGVGSGAAAAAVAAAAGREQELLERVRSLEEQLAGLKGLLTLGPVSNGKAPASH